MPVSFPRYELPYITEETAAYLLDRCAVHVQTSAASDQTERIVFELWSGAGE